MISLRRLFGVAGGLLVAAGVVFACYATVDASPALGWGDVRTAKAVAREDTTATAYGWFMPNCKRQFIAVESPLEIAHYDACVVVRNGIALASYFDFLNRRMYAVRQGSDTHFHYLQATSHSSASGIVLLSDGRLLVSTAYLYVGAYVQHVRDLKVIVHTTNLRTYSFDFEKGTRLKSVSGKEFHSYNIGMSNNQRFATMESVGEGGVLIDLQTLKVRYVYADRSDNYEGLHGMWQAVSSDGRFIAIVDYLYEIARVYEVDEYCGSDILSDEALIPPCYSVDFSVQLQGLSELKGSVPYELKFLEDDRTLVLKSRKSDSVVETTITPDFSAQRLQYLALGDSYSSGEGDISGLPRVKYMAGTDGEEGCHVSPRSYPFLLRDTWGINTLGMRSVACSGAIMTRDYIYDGKGAKEYKGQNNRYTEASPEEYLNMQKQALSGFDPGVVRQIEFVDRYKPKIVTYTGSGNDVGFGEVIGYCATDLGWLAAMPCSYVINAQMRADLNRKIDEQFDTNKQFIERIQAVSPETKIYIIGYPQFISDEPSLCSNSSALLSFGERRMIRESVTRLNNILKKVAHYTDVYYVNIENSLAGGQICDGSKYMSGPLKLGASNFFKGSFQEAYHPNHRGHERMAKRIATEIASGMTYDIIDYPLEGEGRRVIKKAVLPNYSGIGSTHTVSMDPGMFLPDGRVLIEMFSQHAQLAEVAAAEDGSVRTEVTIPKDISVGVHLLTISGQDINGEAVSVQQFVTVTSGIEGDTDGDGIPDSDDPCFVINEWIEDGVNICAPPRPSLVVNGNSNVGQANKRTGLLLAASQPEGVSSFVMGDAFHASVVPFGAAPSAGGDILLKGHVDGEKNNHWWIAGGLSILSAIGVMYYAKRKKETAY